MFFFLIPSVMAEDSVDTATSHANKLSWLKRKINLEVVPTSNEDSKKLLIGKILSSKSFSKSLVKEILIKAWNVINDVEVSAVDKNIFMFSFKHEADVRRAWDRRPWTVKGEHLVLKRFSPDISVLEVDFSFTEFWIQIHGLPLNRRRKMCLKLEAWQAEHWIQIWLALRQRYGVEMLKLELK